MSGYENQKFEKKLALSTHQDVQNFRIAFAVTFSYY